MNLKCFSWAGIHTGSTQVALPVKHMIFTVIKTQSIQISRVAELTP